MDCTDTRELLVAWQDGELSPSATEQVEEHLGRCIHCADHARRLAAATPQPFLRAPDEVLRKLHEALDVDRVLDAASRPPPLAPPDLGLLAWLRKEHEVSSGAMLAYAALLVATFGWGLASWTQGSSAPVVATWPADEIPADQFAPAAYSPEEDADFP